MIDWDVAVSTGVRWARPGPQVSLAEARQTVAELRELAAAVEGPVREVTGLQSKVAPGAVAVVDRAGWIRANVDGFRVVLDPLAEQMRQRSPAANASGLVMGVGSRVTGMQAGLILAYLSARVLGQYELFLPPGSGRNGGEEPVGRLTLVAPNIVMVERELGVDPSDFRRWVCLHEETHRVQFTSVPWLRAYVQEQMTEFLLASDLDPATILSRLRAAADAVAGAVRGSDSESLIEAIQTPRQKEILGRLTALMTLVEGHGDYVMDAVGPPGGAVRRGDQGTVQHQAPDGRPGRAGHPAAARHRSEDAPVRGRRALRPRGRRPDRHGWLQQGLGVPGDHPDHERDQRPRRLDHPGGQRLHGRPRGDRGAHRAVGYRAGERHEPRVQCRPGHRAGPARRG